MSYYQDQQLGIWRDALLKRRPVFMTPEHFAHACYEYFSWAHRNPLKEQKVFNYKGDITYANMDVMRAFSVRALCTFLNISTSTFKSYEKKPGFDEVAQCVRDIIHTQKFEGAAANLLNPTVIMRDLGMAEKSEVSGPGGGPIKNEVSAIDFIQSRIDSIADARRKAGDIQGDDGGSGAEPEK